jgi:ADP-ribose pyrophosphatase
MTATGPQHRLRSPSIGPEQTNMPRPRRVEIRSQTRRFDDVFKIDEIVVAHERFDGTMSPNERKLVFERGDAAALLLLNTDRNAVVLVEQFRAPVLIGRQRADRGASDGWTIEAIAGMIDPGEAPDAAIIREAMEETGYRVRRPQLISTYFVSPGGSSERVFLYFAEVRDADRTGAGGGTDDDEDIRTIELSVDELFARLTAGKFDDPKLMIAAYWLQARLRTRKRLIDRH